MCALVSIITPAYNAEKNITESINSVINQDYYNWEMLIVNDCSKDNTEDIVNQYLEKDSRIKLISLEENGGVANARNIALDQASGRYIAFLDSDDMWHKNKLSKQIDFMKKNEYAFTFTEYELMDESGMKLNKRIKIPRVVDHKRLLKGNPIGCLTVMIDKDKIENINMPNIGHEDYATWLNIIENGEMAYGLNENLSLYRKASNSISSNKLKTVMWMWSIYRNHQNLSLLKSVNYLFMYSFNALLKYS